MRISIFFRWFDLWVGAYVDMPNRTLYVCPLPTLGLKVQFDSKAHEANVETLEYPPPGSFRREELVHRLCSLVDSVWSHFDRYGHEPNDCFCKAYVDDARFRSSGQALLWIESVVGRELSKERERCS